MCRQVPPARTHLARFAIAWLTEGHGLIAVDPMRASDPPRITSSESLRLPTIPPPARLPRGLVVPPPSGASTSSPSIERLSFENVRRSILSVLPPLPMSKSALHAPLAALSIIVAMLATTMIWMWSTGRMPERLARALQLGPLPGAAALVAPPPLIAAEEEPAEPETADVKFGRSPAAGGVLSLPTSFAPAADGAFDLVVHLHGNTDLALESYEAVGIGAAVVVYNLGTGSGAYEDRFSNPQALLDVIERSEGAVRGRGVKRAHARRIAIVGWSAGYGGALRSLGHGPHADRIDAVVLLDGLHVGYREGTQTVDPLPIAPMQRFAARAAAGEKLLVITHSNIDPGGYLGVKETTDLILAELGLSREKVAGKTQLPILMSMQGVLPKDEMAPLERRTEARRGGLIVRGYGGNQPTHHISHLMQMSQIALPLLVDRWRAPAQ